MLCTIVSVCRFEKNEICLFMADRLSAKHHLSIPERKESLSRDHTEICSLNNWARMVKTTWADGYVKK